MNQQHDMKQVRYTLEDCLASQRKLRAKLQHLIADNRPLHEDEKQDFFTLLAKALLSQGTADAMNMVIDSGWYTFASCQNYALRLAEITSSRVELTTDRPEKAKVILPISELWQFLYEKLLYLFPRANAEAIHISAESVHPPPQGRFKFSAETNLDNVKR